MQSNSVEIRTAPPHGSPKWSDSTVNGADQHLVSEGRSSNRFEGAREDAPCKHNGWALLDAPQKKDDYLLIERFGLQLMVPLTLTDLQCFYLNT